MVFRVFHMYILIEKRVEHLSILNENRLPPFFFFHLLVSVLKKEKRKIEIN